MSDEVDDLRDEVERLRQEVDRLKRTPVGVRCVRKRSSKEFFGLPLYDIALGPDFEKGEIRGHAKGIVAIGDVATGFLAFGGVARGLLAFGGLAVGGITFGGCSIGLLLAV